MSTRPHRRGLLFDLDGTLADTAPDLLHALNRLRAELALPPLAEARLRPWVSLGARAMVEHGIPEISDPDRRETLRLRFLDLYHQQPAQEVRLFPGVEALLAQLRLPWAVVTNKPARMAGPVMQALGLAHIPLVAGDTLPQAKPHPAPILHACQQLGLPPADCLMVGDGQRDIEAGQAAGCATLSVGFGYIPPGETPLRWQADAHAEQVADMATYCLRWQQGA